MSNSENEDAAANPQPKPKKKKRSKLLILGVPAFVLLMGGGAGAWWYFNQSAEAGSAAEEQPAENDHASAGLLTLDPFIVNLADLGGRKYLRLTMVLQVPSEKIAKEVEEAPLRMSRLRSAIIEMLTTSTSADLGTAAGRAALKKSVAETAKHVARLDVTDVLFEEFIIQ